jgi:ribonuclease P/MRP protein subunit RPP40
MELLGESIVPAKCVLSQGLMPSYVDPKQPPTKKRPFSAIMSQPLSHSVVTPDS